MKSKKPKLKLVVQQKVEIKNPFNRGDEVVIRNSIFPVNNMVIPVRVFSVLTNVDDKVFLSNLQSYDPSSLESYDPADYNC